MNPLCASGDETCDLRQDLISEAEGMIKPVDEDVMVRSVKGSGEI